jgi:hypothetical protein
VKWHARIDSLHALLKTYQDSIFYIKWNKKGPSIMDGPLNGAYYKVTSG